MQNQIPKVIHYCWFGRSALPPLAHKCIASWQKFLPDYEIRQWNEDNFDVHQAPYVDEAYRLKRYAHVSDYARFWILYHHGGIYFDTDVEVVRPLDDLIAKGSFAGFECPEGSAMDNPNGDMNPGLGIAVPPHHPFFRTMLNYYNHHHYVRWNGKNSGNITEKATRFLDYQHQQQLEGGVVRVSELYIYPIEYFCPMNYYTGQMNITPNTRTIHHYMASWVTTTNRFRNARLRARAIITRIICSFKHYNP